MKKQKKEKTSPDQKPDGKPRRSAAARARYIEALLRKIEDRLESEEGAGTVSEYIRLLELRKQFLGERIKRVEVTWVEPSKDPDACKT